MIVCREDREAYELMVNLNKNDPKKLIEDYVDKFFETAKEGIPIDVFRFLEGLPQSQAEKVDKALNPDVLKKFENFLLTVHETWKKNFLDNQKKLLEKCKKEDAPIIYAIAKFLENKINPITLKELEYTYKMKIPYMFEGVGHEVTLSQYSPIVSKSLKMFGFDTQININTNNLYNYEIGENLKESIIYLNPKIENIVDICGKIIEYSKGNYIPMDITFQNFTITLKNKNLADAIERTNKIEVKLDDKYVTHFLTFLKTFNEKTKILEGSGKLPRVVEVYEKYIGISENLNLKQKSQAQTFTLHRTYFLQEATAHTVRDILCGLADFSKEIVMDEYAFGRKFQQIENLFASGLCLEDEKTDKRKTMIFMKKHLLNDKYMFRDLDNLYEEFSKEVNHRMTKETFKGHIVTSFMNVARKVFLDCSKEEILPLMYINATRLCKLFDISKETYAFQNEKMQNYKKAAEFTSVPENIVDRKIKDSAEKLYLFDKFQYYPMIEKGEEAGIYIAGYVELPMIKEAYRALLCVSNNRIREINGISRVIYKMYPITFTYDNRARLPQILEMIAKFSSDVNFIKHIESSHGYLGRLSIKDSTSPNAFGAFIGWNYMDIPIWEIAKNTYNEVQSTGNMLTQCGIRCFYEDKSEERIKKYLFVKNLEFGYVDLMQVFCTLRDNINRKIGANVLSFMLEQPEIYKKYDALKSDYMGDLYKDGDKYKLHIELDVKKEIDEMLYARFIGKFPEIEMSKYVNKEVYITKNDFDLDARREKERLEEIKRAIIKEKQREREHDEKIERESQENIVEDNEILTTSLGITAEDIARMQNLTNAGMVGKEEIVNNASQVAETVVQTQVEQPVQPIQQVQEVAKPLQEVIEEKEEIINPYKNGMVVAKVEKQEQELDENGEQVVPELFISKPKKEVDLEPKVFTKNVAEEVEKNELEEERRRLEIERKRLEEEKARIEKQKREEEEIRRRADEEKARVPNIPARPLYEEAPESDFSFIQPKITKQASYDDDDIIIETLLPSEARARRNSDSKVADHFIHRAERLTQEGEELKRRVEEQKLQEELERKAYEDSTGANLEETETWD